MRAGVFAEDVAQGRDVLAEVIFLDDRVRPNRLHQPLFIQHGIVVLDHVEERIEDSRCEGNRRPIAPPQETCHRVEPEITEFVDMGAGSLHRLFRKIQKNSVAA